MVLDSSWNKTINNVVNAVSECIPVYLKQADNPSRAHAQLGFGGFCSIVLVRVCFMNVC